jgi:hypothetical protein
MCSTQLLVSICVHKNIFSHHKNFVSVHCHLQNGIHIVHPLHGQIGGSQIMPNLGYEQDEEEESIPFFDCLVCASWCEAGIVMKEKDVFHILFGMNPVDVLSQFV